MAEAVRFELTDPFEPLVFKTSAIDHSTTLPLAGDRRIELLITESKSAVIPFN